MCVSDVCVKKTGDADPDGGSGSPDEDDQAAEPDEDQPAESDESESDEDPDESEEDPTESEEDTEESGDDPTDSDEESQEDESAAADDTEDTDPTDEATDAPSEQQELEDGSVGSACGECDAELVCVPDVPGGYCSGQCTTNADCGAAGACVANVCYRECNADADCRPSYACLDAGDVSVCDVGESTETGSDGETGSCANTCEHYLTCKGIFDSETQQTCEGNCASSGYASDDLAAFQATDCETAIYMVEGPASSEGGSGSGSGGVDCDGCEWDGSSCVYLSQYTLISTAGFTCDASCCE